MTIVPRRGAVVKAAHAPGVPGRLPGARGARVARDQAGGAAADRRREEPSCTRMCDEMEREAAAGNASGSSRSTTTSTRCSFMRRATRSSRSVHAQLIAPDGAAAEEISRAARRGRAIGGRASSDPRRGRRRRSLSGPRACSRSTSRFPSGSCARARRSRCSEMTRSPPPTTRPGQPTTTRGAQWLTASRLSSESTSTTASR